MSTPLIFSNFSEDCLLEILGRLPPDSLMRFRSVSKSWRALIDSPEFIRMHLNCSIIDSIKSPQFLFNTKPFGRDGRQIWSLKSDENMQHDVSKLTPPVLLSDGYVVGCINGLICMASPGTEEVVLWNPWIRKSFELPEITYPACQDSRGRPYRSSFGYNDLADEYKVVQFVNLYDYRNSLQLCTEVYVYGTKCHYWTKLPNFPYRMLPLYSPGCGSGIFANGALHWTVLERDACFIAAIDLRTEKYRLIPLPEDLHSKLIGLPSAFIGAVDGSLCIIPPVDYRDNPPVHELSVWLMKKYGGKDSWTKLNVRVPGYEKALRGDLILLPIGLTEEDKSLLALQRQGKLIVQYDIKNQTLVEKVQNVQDCSKGCTNVHSNSIVIAYKWVPSIVPVPHPGEKTQREMPKEKRYKSGGKLQGPSVIRVV